MKRIHAALPVLASLAAFILTLLALLAGSVHGPNSLRDYDMIMFNTSGLGKDFLLSREKPAETPTPAEEDPSRCDKLLLDDLIEKCKKGKEAAADAVDKAKDKVNEIANDIVDRLADELGIKEYYALHVMTLCEGDFTPNATAPSASRNTTDCTQVFPNGVYNVSALLDKELRAGPFQIGIEDIGISDTIQDAVDTINSLVKAFAILLIVSVALTGLSFVVSTVPLLFPGGDRENVTLLANVVVSALATFVLLFTSMFVTIGMHMAADKVNEKGADVGLSATAGKGYTGLTWAAVGLMLVLVFGFWLWQLLRFRKTNKPTAHSGKPRDSEESGAYSHGKGGRPNMSSFSRGKFLGRRR